MKSSNEIYASSVYDSGHDTGVKAAWDKAGRVQACVRRVGRGGTMRRGRPSGVA